MTDDRGDQIPETPLPQAAEPPHGFPANILDALDIDGVGEIDIAVERILSRPCPATFD